MHLDEEDEALIWWTIGFIAALESVYSLPSKAIGWILSFVSVLFHFGGLYCHRLRQIADVFPKTLYQKNRLIEKKIHQSSFVKYVVCRKCHFLYKPNECLEKRGGQTVIKTCKNTNVSSTLCRNQLLRTVITSDGKHKYYPYLTFAYKSLVESLKGLFARKGLYELCQKNRMMLSTDGTMRDVHDGKIWHHIKTDDGSAFLTKENNFALMLNIDWFQPFKHRQYSVGVIYLVLVNLPRKMRFKRENVILVGLIPGPNEPKKTVNHFLKPLVDELLTLWQGVLIYLSNGRSLTLRFALICVACDIPASRKVCGFLSHTANLGCSKCYCEFFTGMFGKNNYSNFEREKWISRSNYKHRHDVNELKLCRSESALRKKESEVGCRYSVLLDLPYFDPIVMTIIDPMHNMYIGTAKHIFQNIWLKHGRLSAESLNSIDSVIKSFKITPNMKLNQIPSVHCLSSFTAENWMKWICYFAIVCLKDILTSQELEWLRHFVLACRLLNKKELSQSDVQLADALLMQFCKRCISLYGQDSATPNMHLHCHLRACIEDFGPIANFWLFSFERCNGILGNLPHNNKNIECQLMDRFMNDNSQIHLLNLLSEDKNNVSELFVPLFHNHSSTLLTMSHSELINVENNYKPDIKCTIHSFSQSQLLAITKLYKCLYPTLNCSMVPSSHRLMKRIEINGLAYVTGQYVLARPIFPFSSDTNRHEQTTYFSDFSVRIAQVSGFVTHSLPFSSSESFVSKLFAMVSWPCYHPSRHYFGKPYEVYCNSTFEFCSDNQFVPIENILGIALSCTYTINDETVLVVSPLIS